MESVTISSGLAVSVNVDKYGKYVQFVKNSTTITFHEEQWQVLYSSIDKITEALENDKSIDIMVSPTSHIKTAKLFGQNYVSFSQYPPDKYVNLDSFEWNTFVKNLCEINSQYKLDVLYRGAMGGWQLVKAAVEGEILSYKLAERYSDHGIVVLLKSYLTVKEIEKTTSGCKHVPNAKWCEKCWKKTVEKKFSLCNTVDFTSKLERLNNYMNWNVCLPQSTTQWPLSKRVYDVVYINKNDRIRCACDCVKFDLPYIYRDLFKFLNL